MRGTKRARQGWQRAIPGRRLISLLGGAPMPIMVDGRNAAVLRQSYTKLHHYNPKMCEVLTSLQIHVEKKYKKNVTITQIDRSQKENDRIYKASAKKQRKTAHGVWAAVDIRSRDFTSAEIAEIVSFLNSSYNDKNSNPLKNGDTAMCHEVPGHGVHFHIQYAPLRKKH
jgi:hypothetical protein